MTVQTDHAAHEAAARAGWSRIRSGAGFGGLWGLRAAARGVYDAEMPSPTNRLSALNSEVLDTPERVRCPKRRTDHLVLVTELGALHAAVIAPSVKTRIPDQRVARATSFETRLRAGVAS